MKQNITTLLTVLLIINFSFSQIPIEEYRTEIENLKTEKKINEYWNKLYKIDQDILMNTTNLKIADSISISNMIKTALLFDIYGTKGYNPNGTSSHISIINLTHNYIGESQIAYWPIIKKCAEIGGAINSYAGKYPSYELESVTTTFYNYSLLNQEQKYPKLLSKMNEIKTVNIVDKLLNSFKYQNQMRELFEVKVLHHWQLQSFKNLKEEGVFSFVKMSDNNIYLKKHGRAQKLELVRNQGKSKIYRIENEPFGWNYIYGEDGSLSLIDDEQNELIKYTLVK
ncbi:hypothetical protein [Pseudofulvibacter geojedonensis]|uniref:Uncharacterized protein n=1 Tax=Pseudofulvibacter geojedonensis TaxID=1123758 RepID=A0ABW3HZE2_9FLAO